MTSPAPRPIDPSPAPPFAAPLVALVVAAKLALHLATLAVTRFGIQRDEFLYLAMGAHLRLWRMDFPPLIALVANASRAVFGHSLAVVRVPPMLVGCATVVAAALVARALGGGRRAQALAALCATASGLFLRAGTLFQPVVLDQLWWTLALLALAMLGRDGRPRWWLAFGAAVGLGLLTKFSILFFGAGALVGIVLSPSRRWLATRWPWLAAAVALAIGAPSVVGQVRLGFPVVGQMRDLQGEQLVHVSWSDFLTAQPRMIGYVPFALAVLGAVALVAWRPWRAWAALGWTCLAAFALLFVLHGKAYYIGPIYPALCAAGCARLDGWRSRWATPALALASLGTIAFAALVTPLGVPILSPAATADYATRIGAASSLRTNTGAMDRLPQDFADMIGWDAQARALADVVRTLAPADRAAAVILAGNYGEAGAAEFYGPRFALPPVVCAAGSYWFFGPGARPGAVLVTIGVDSADVAKVYGDVRRAGIVRSPWSVAEEREVPVFVARAPRQTLQALWPSLAGRN